jgi:hypothetical protein
MPLLRRRCIFVTDIGITARSLGKDKIRSFPILKGFLKIIKSR